MTSCLACIDFAAVNYTLQLPKWDVFELEGWFSDGEVHNRPGKSMGIDLRQLNRSKLNM